MARPLNVLDGRDLVGGAVRLLLEDRMSRRPIWLSIPYRKKEPSKEQRTWVGLTDEERMELYSKFTDSDEWTYEKAIEAKLKEKNT
jgi:hypothetical protein